MTMTTTAMSCHEPSAILDSLSRLRPILMPLKATPQLSRRAACQQTRWSSAANGWAGCHFHRRRAA
jgi:hypothetical protein